jgi:hypothetical protein
MSYEGYTQYLCKKGHLRTQPHSLEIKPRCSCGELFVWGFEVDQTNDDGQPALLVLNERPVQQICASCGHEKTIKEGTWHIPPVLGPDAQGYRVYPEDVEESEDIRELLEDTEDREGVPKEAIWL